ncbi:MAG: DUF2934 domain-containing protein, partial [Nitrospirota bacterium]
KHGRMRRRMMSKETTVSPGSEKSTPAEQAARRAEAHQGHVAQRAYELYEQRGRQEGCHLEDWLNAERQLMTASGKSGTRP